MIQSGSAVKLGGALNVEFSGAGATGHTLGNKWNLITATTGVANNFTNLGVGNEITVSGLASPAPPIGSAYYLRTVNGGNGKLVQLSYEGVLVLNVNRDTGELKITNPLGGDIAIDAYQVTLRPRLDATLTGLGIPRRRLEQRRAEPRQRAVRNQRARLTLPIDNNDAYNVTGLCRRSRSAPVSADRRRRPTSPTSATTAKT